MNMALISNECNQSIDASDCKVWIMMISCIKRVLIVAHFSDDETGKVQHIPLLEKACFNYPILLGWSCFKFEI